MRVNSWCVEYCSEDTGQSQAEFWGMFSLLLKMLRSLHREAESSVNYAVRLPCNREDMCCLAPLRIEEGLGHL